jgi:hypothetical protein
MPTAKKTKKPATKSKKPAATQKLHSLDTLQKELIKHTDAICKQHLNTEYRDMCRVMAKGLCVDESPARVGDPATWAKAIVATVGYVNFLDDPEMKPFISRGDLAKKMGISQTTLNKHRKVLIDGFDIIPFDPDFTLPSLIPMNPLIAMATSPTLLAGDCCEEGSCCVGGSCSMEGCDREDCCKLAAVPKKKATKTRK